MLTRILLLLLVALPVSAQTLTGTAVADPAVPTLISPSVNGSDYFVLNKDLTLSGRFRSATTQSITCPAPAGFSASSSTPRTLINDASSAYFTAQSTSANVAASTDSPGYPCTSAAALPLAGGTPTQTFSTNDQRHGRYTVLEAFGGNGADTLTVLNNLNTNTSSTPTLTKAASVSLDTGGTYTAMVTDEQSNYGNTAITQLRTGTSAGGLWVYSPGIQTVVKILGPGGVPLPAIGAFILPATANDNGDLLVLVNQDNLTSSNLASPPAVTNPFTIIDLGQLQRAFSAITGPGQSITLPSVTQIHATTSYYGMLGAAYSPVFHLLYALVASGTSTSSVTQSIIRYDPTNPTAPAETVVADVSNIPFTFGTYPQLALNSAAGSMEILSAGALYHVVIAGKGNTATAVTGTPFPDSNFKPTFVASNTLLGETYIASASQVDILTLSGTAVPRAVIELYGTDNAIANQSYTLYANGINPNSDATLALAPVTITATPAGGSPVVLATVPFYSFTGAPGTSTSITFPAAGIYTVVASVPATGSFPAFSSLPIKVGVGATGVAAVYPTNTRLIVPSTSTSTTVTATLTLFGSTYAPSGRIVVSDATGNEVGRYTLNGRALAFPVNVTLTLPAGASTLTATYNGDTQNQTSTSPAVTITVGNQAKSSLGLSIPATAAVGATLNGTVFYSAAAGATGTPTGNILIQATAGTSTTTLATVPVATAFNNPTAGATFTFTAPASGTYAVTGTYAGDSNFSAGASTANSLVTTSPLVATTTNLSAVATATTGTAFPVTVSFKTTAGSTAPSGFITVQATNAAGSATILGTVTLAQAQASGGYALQATLATAEIYSITATYNGDANYSPSAGTVSVVVQAATLIATATNVSAVATASAGTAFPVTISFKTTAGNTAPTGFLTVQATNAAGSVTILGTVTLAQAQAAGGYALQATLATAGTYSITATYNGDANYSPSAGTIGVVVTAPAPTIRLTAPASTPNGKPFNITVSLSAPGIAGTPTGNIILTYNKANGPQQLGSVSAATAFANGATASIVLPDAGTISVIAAYAGDTNFKATSQAVNVTVVPFANLSILGPVTAVYGDGIPLKIVLTSSFTSTPPTGTLDIKALDATLGPIYFDTVSAASAFAAGGVSTNPFYVSTGINNLVATYAGDAVYPPITAMLTITVQRSVPQISISAPTSVPEGSRFDVAVKANGIQPSLPPGTGVITVNATPVSGGTAAITRTLATSSFNGVLPLTLTAGSYTLTAVYSGDVNNTTASSNTIGIAVTASSNHVIVTGPATSTLGSRPTFNIALRSSSATALPTGTLTLGYINATGYQVISIGGIKASDAFSAKGTDVAFDFDRFVGPTQIIANYPGDSNYPPLIGEFAHTVTRANAKVGITGASQAFLNTPYAVTVGLYSAVNATQLITLSAINSSSQAVATLSIDPNNLANSPISYFNFSSAGNYTILASYPGDDFILPSTTSYSLNVIPAPPTNFTLKLDDPTAGNSAGALQLSGASPAVVQLTLTSVGAGPGPVMLSYGQLAFNGYVQFTDSNGKVINQATPIEAGTHITASINIGSSASNAPGSFPAERSVPLAVCLMLGGLLGIRKRHLLLRKTLAGLSVLALLVASSTLLSGCTTSNFTVLITATPVTASAAAPPQSVAVTVSYTH